MLIENEEKIKALCTQLLSELEDGVKAGKPVEEVCTADELADRFLRVIREDERTRRSNLVQRQSEGLKKARDRGVRLGRPPVKKPRKFMSIYTMYVNGQISARAAAQMLQVSPGTFKRWQKEVQERDGE